jgi:serine/threonine protein kinase
MKKSLEREKSINQLLKSINCPYFVEFIDSFSDSNNVYFIYEFC